MKTILARLKGETPWFFMKVKAICVLTGLSCAAGYNCTDLPPIVTKLLPLAITAAVTAFTVAQLTVKYPEDLPKESEPNQPSE